MELEFYGEVDVENSKTHVSGANVHFMLRKKEMKQEYWPRLLKESKRVHYLKTDFDKVSHMQRHMHTMSRSFMCCEALR